ncbi:MAG: hypothetical protein JOY71_29785 [Acetobacteraceae bacterium]|nr:hypothetical protein [Acetobacteraceae bacterium]MBV8526255.1 hypothetical protein [Acetobacteraceae bacterium]
MSKAPVSSLEVIPVKGQGAKPEPVLPASSPRPRDEPRTAMTWRPRISVHDRLRHIAFHDRRSMQELIDEAVDEWLNKR